MDQIASPDLSEGETKRIEFTAGDFLSLLRSDKFVNALGIAAGIESSDDVESGFDVEIGPNKEVYIENVKKGRHSSMEDAMVDTVIDESPPDDVVDLIGLHFHERKGISPSKSDFRDIQSKQDAHFIVIGINQEDGSIALLIIKRPKYPLSNSDVNEYLKKTTSYSSGEEVLRELRNIGLEVGLIGYVPMEKSDEEFYAEIEEEKMSVNYKLSEESEEIIRQLGSVTLTFPTK